MIEICSGGRAEKLHVACTHVNLVSECGSKYTLHAEVVGLSPFDIKNGAKSKNGRGAAGGQPPRGAEPLIRTESGVP